MTRISWTKWNPYFFPKLAHGVCTGPPFRVQNFSRSHRQIKMVPLQRLKRGLISYQFMFIYSNQSNIVHESCLIVTRTGHEKSWMRRRHFHVVTLLCAVCLLPYFHAYENWILSIPSVSSPTQSKTFFFHFLLHTWIYHVITAFHTSFIYVNGDHIWFIVGIQFQYVLCIWIWWEIYTSKSIVCICSCSVWFIASINDLQSRC